MAGKGFRQLMVPVDLGHVEALQRSLDIAGDLAARHGARVTYVGITGSLPGRAAASPEAFARDLALFAGAQAEAHGIETASHAIACADVAADKDRLLLQAIDELDADLVVMASHLPGIADRLHLIGSDAAWLVRHAEVSVFVVR